MTPPRFTLSLAILLTLVAAGCGEDGSGGVPNDIGTFDTGNDAADMLRAVNAHRAAGANCGGRNMPPVPPLTRNAILEEVAQAHSEDMVARGFFAHTNPDGETPFERMTDAGYSWRSAGENIAAGGSTVDATMNQWMNSPGHCENIMSGSNTEFGMGRAQNHWTQVFGAPR